MLFLNRFRTTCRESGSKIAIDFRDGRTTVPVSYEELGLGTARTAAWLAHQGIRPGDRVAICLPKSIAGIHLHLAACSMGAISMPVNPAYSTSELNYLLNDSQASLLVVSEDSNREGPSAQDPGPVSTRVRAIDTQRFSEQLPSPAPGAFEYASESDRTALMLYTSGTTGAPKGACLTHGCLTANIEMLAEAWEWSEHDVLLHALPVFHVHGLLVALHGALHARATSIVHSVFEAGWVMDTLRSGECTVFMGVPTMYQRILSHLGDEIADLGHMRLLTSGSDRLPVDAFLRIERQLGMRVVERYGMTETGIMSSNPLDGPRVAGQVGIPLPGVQMRICDPETGAETRDGEVGEVQTIGPHLFSGYWNDPEKTRRSYTGDGWFRTGDLGFRDQYGRFELKGRSKDVIITGGLNVYPSEVEHVLMTHTDVAQCAVVGLPDPEWGESVTAFVVPRPKAGDTSELIAHCRRSLAGYKTPKRVILVDTLPRNAMGKIQKSVLRREPTPP